MIWQYVLTYYKWPTTLTSVVLRVHLFPYVCKFVCVCVYLAYTFAVHPL